MFDENELHHLKVKQGNLIINRPPIIKCNYERNLEYTEKIHFSKQDSCSVIKPYFHCEPQNSSYIESNVFDREFDVNSFIDNDRPERMQDYVQYKTKRLNINENASNISQISTGIFQDGPDLILKDVNKMNNARKNNIKVFKSSTYKNDELGIKNKSAKETDMPFVNRFANMIDEKLEKMQCTILEYEKDNKILTNKLRDSLVYNDQKIEALLSTLYKNKEKKQDSTKDDIINLNISINQNKDKEKNSKYTRNRFNTTNKKVKSKFLNFPEENLSFALENVTSSEDDSMCKLISDKRLSKLTLSDTSEDDTIDDGTLSSLPSDERSTNYSLPQMGAHQRPELIMMMNQILNEHDNNPFKTGSKSLGNSIKNFSSKTKSSFMSSKYGKKANADTLDYDESTLKDKKEPQKKPNKNDLKNAFISRQILTKDGKGNKEIASKSQKSAIKRLSTNFDSIIDKSAKQKIMVEFDQYEKSSPKRKNYEPKVIQTFETENFVRLRVPKMPQNSFSKLVPEQLGDLRAGKDDLVIVMEEWLERNFVDEDETDDEFGYIQFHPLFFILGNDYEGAEIQLQEVTYAGQNTANTNNNSNTNNFTTSRVLKHNPMRRISSVCRKLIKMNKSVSKTRYVNEKFDLNDAKTKSLINSDNESKMEYKSFHNSNGYKECQCNVANASLKEKRKNKRVVKRSSSGISSDSKKNKTMKSSKKSKNKTKEFSNIDSSTKTLRTNSKKFSQFQNNTKIRPRTNDISIKGNYLRRESSMDSSNKKIPNLKLSGGIRSSSSEKKENSKKSGKKSHKSKHRKSSTEEMDIEGSADTKSNHKAKKKSRHKLVRKLSKKIKKKAKSYFNHKRHKKKKHDKKSSDSSNQENELTDFPSSEDESDADQFKVHQQPIHSIKKKKKKKKHKKNKSSRKVSDESGQSSSADTHLTSSDVQSIRDSIKKAHDNWSELESATEKLSNTEEKIESLTKNFDKYLRNIYKNTAKNPALSNFDDDFAQEKDLSDTENSLVSAISLENAKISGQPNIDKINDEIKKEPQTLSVDGHISEATSDLGKDPNNKASENTQIKNEPIDNKPQLLSVDGHISQAPTNLGKVENIGEPENKALENGQNKDKNDDQKPNIRSSIAGVNLTIQKKESTSQDTSSEKPVLTQRRSILKEDNLKVQDKLNKPDQNATPSIYTISPNDSKKNDITEESVDNLDKEKCDEMKALIKKLSTLSEDIDVEEKKKKEDEAPSKGTNEKKSKLAKEEKTKSSKGGKRKKSDDNSDSSSDSEKEVKNKKKRHSKKKKRKDEDSDDDKSSDSESEKQKHKKKYSKRKKGKSKKDTDDKDSTDSENEEPRKRKRKSKRKKLKNKKRNKDNDSDESSDSENGIKKKRKKYRKRNKHRSKIEDEYSDEDTSSDSEEEKDAKKKKKKKSKNKTKKLRTDDSSDSDKEKRIKKEDKQKTESGEDKKENVPIKETCDTLYKPKRPMNFERSMEHLTTPRNRPTTTHSFRFPEDIKNLKKYEYINERDRDRVTELLIILQDRDIEKKTRARLKKQIDLILEAYTDNESTNTRYRGESKDVELNSNISSSSKSKKRAKPKKERNEENDEDDYEYEDDMKSSRTLDDFDDDYEDEERLSPLKTDSNRRRRRVEEETDDVPSRRDNASRKSVKRKNKSPKSFQSRRRRSMKDLASEKRRYKRGRRQRDIDHDSRLRSKRKYLSALEKIVPDGKTLKKIDRYLRENDSDEDEDETRGSHTYPKFEYANMRGNYGNMYQQPVQERRNIMNKHYSLNPELYQIGGMVKAEYLVSKAHADPSVNSRRFANSRFKQSRAIVSDYIQNSLAHDFVENNPFISVKFFENTNVRDQKLTAEYLIDANPAILGRGSPNPYPSQGMNQYVYSAQTELSNPFTMQSVFLTDDSHNKSLEFHKHFNSTESTRNTMRQFLMLPSTDNSVDKIQEKLEHTTRATSQNNTFYLTSESDIKLSDESYSTSEALVVHRKITGTYKNDLVNVAENVIYKANQTNTFKKYSIEKQNFEICTHLCNKNEIFNKECDNLLYKKGCSVVIEVYESEVRKNITSEYMGYSVNQKGVSDQIHEKENLLKSETTPNDLNIFKSELKHLISDSNSSSMLCVRNMKDDCKNVVVFSEKKICTPVKLTFKETSAYSSQNIIPIEPISTMQHNSGFDNKETNVLTDSVVVMSEDSADYPNVINHKNFRKAKSNIVSPCDHIMHTNQVVRNEDKKRFVSCLVKCPVNNEELKSNEPLFMPRYHENEKINNYNACNKTMEMKNGHLESNDPLDSMNPFGLKNIPDQQHKSLNIKKALISCINGNIQDRGIRNESTFMGEEVKFYSYHADDKYKERYGRREGIFNANKDMEMTPPDLFSRENSNNTKSYVKKIKFEDCTCVGKKEKTYRKMLSENIERTIKHLKCTASNRTSIGSKTKTSDKVIATEVTELRDDCIQTQEPESFYKEGRYSTTVMNNYKNVMDEPSTAFMQNVNLSLKRISQDSNKLINMLDKSKSELESFIETSNISSQKDKLISKSRENFQKDLSQNIDRAIKEWSLKTSNNSEMRTSEKITATEVIKLKDDYNQTEELERLPLEASNLSMLIRSEELLTNEKSKTIPKDAVIPSQQVQLVGETLVEMLNKRKRSLKNFVPNQQEENFKNNSKLTVLSEAIDKSVKQLNAEIERSRDSISRTSEKITATEVKEQKDVYNQTLEPTTIEKEERRSSLLIRNDIDVINDPILAAERIINVPSQHTIEQEQLSEIVNKEKKRPENFDTLYSDNISPNVGKFISKDENYFRKGLSENIEKSIEQLSTNTLKDTFEEIKTKASENIIAHEVNDLNDEHNQELASLQSARRLSSILRKNNKNLVNEPNAVMMQHIDVPFRRISQESKSLIEMLDQSKFGLGNYEQQQPENTSLNKEKLNLRNDEFFNRQNFEIEKILELVQLRTKVICSQTEALIDEYKKQMIANDMSNLIYSVENSFRGLFKEKIKDLSYVFDSTGLALHSYLNDIAKLKERPEAIKDLIKKDSILDIYLQRKPTDELLSSPQSNEFSCEQKLAMISEKFLDLKKQLSRFYKDQNQNKADSNSSYCNHEQTSSRISMMNNFDQKNRIKCKIQDENYNRCSCSSNSDGGLKQIMSKLHHLQRQVDDMQIRTRPKTPSQIECSEKVMPHIGNMLSTLKGLMIELSQNKRQHTCKSSSSLVFSTSSGSLTLSSTQSPKCISRCKVSKHGNLKGIAKPLHLKHKKHKIKPIDIEEIKDLKKKIKNQLSKYNELSKKKANLKPCGLDGRSCRSNRSHTHKSSHKKGHSSKTPMRRNSPLLTMDKTATERTPVSAKTLNEISCLEGDTKDQLVDIDPSVMSNKSKSKVNFGDGAQTVKSLYSNVGGISEKDVITVSYVVNSDGSIQCLEEDKNSEEMCYCKGRGVIHQEDNVDPLSDFPNTEKLNISDCSDGVCHSVKMIKFEQGSPPSTVKRKFYKYNFVGPDDDDDTTEEISMFKGNKDKISRFGSLKNFDIKLNELPDNCPSNLLTMLIEKERKYLASKLKRVENLLLKNEIVPDVNLEDLVNQLKGLCVKAEVSKGDDARSELQDYTKHLEKLVKNSSDLNDIHMIELLVKLQHLQNQVMSGNKLIGMEGLVEAEESLVENIHEMESKIEQNEQLNLKNVEEIRSRIKALLSKKETSTSACECKGVGESQNNLKIWNDQEFSQEVRKLNFTTEQDVSSNVSEQTFPSEEENNGIIPQATRRKVFDLIELLRKEVSKKVTQDIERMREIISQVEQVKNNVDKIIDLCRQQQAQSRMERLKVTLCHGDQVSFNELEIKKSGGGNNCCNKNCTIGCTATELITIPHLHNLKEQVVTSNCYDNDSMGYQDSSGTEDSSLSSDTDTHVLKLKNSLYSMLVT